MSISEVESHLLILNNYITFFKIFYKDKPFAKF